MIHDIVEEKDYELTLDKFNKGFIKWMNFVLKRDGDFARIENFDAEDGDIVIQFAVLDEIVYG
jgi:hypothetical protein